MESSLNIPRDRSHMRTSEIKLNLGAIMAKKNTDCTKKRTADTRCVDQSEDASYTLLNIQR